MQGGGNQVELRHLPELRRESWVSKEIKVPRICKTNPLRDNIYTDRLNSRNVQKIDQNISSAPETPFVPPPSCYSLPRGNSYADLQPHRSFLPVFDLCNKWNCRARTIIHCGLFGVWLCLLTIPLWDSFLLFQVDTELHSTCCVVFHCISITHLSIPVFLGMWVISSFTYFIFTVSTSFPWKWLF